MNKKSIFVLGDSISIHYGPYLKNMLEGIFKYERKEETSLEFKTSGTPGCFSGANGGDSRMVWEYMQYRFLGNSIKYDYLLLNCGLHDIKIDRNTGNRQIPLDEYKQNLENTLEHSDMLGIKVIWIRSTPVDNDIHNTEHVNFYLYKEDIIIYNETAGSADGAA